MYCCSSVGRWLVVVTAEEVITWKSLRWDSCWGSLRLLACCLSVRWGGCCLGVVRIVLLRTWLFATWEEEDCGKESY